MLEPRSSTSSTAMPKRPFNWLAKRRQRAVGLLAAVGGQRQAHDQALRLPFAQQCLDAREARVALRRG